MDGQMKKGVLEMCLLYIVSKEDLYGYDLMKRMENRFPDVDESTFYAILRRLHKAGSTETYVSEESNGPNRKYYRITPAGRKTLEASIADWFALTDTVHELGIRKPPPE